MSATAARRVVLHALAPGPRAWRAVRTGLLAGASAQAGAGEALDLLSGPPHHLVGRLAVSSAHRLAVWAEQEGTACRAVLYDAERDVARELVRGGDCVVRLEVPPASPHVAVVSVGRALFAFDSAAGGATLPLPARDAGTAIRQVLPGGDRIEHSPSASPPGWRRVSRDARVTVLWTDGGPAAH